jgi:hypothetical protein
VLNVREKDNLGDSGVDGKIILNNISSISWLVNAQVELVSCPGNT